jgi:hypothetical protein
MLSKSVDTGFPRHSVLDGRAPDNNGNDHDDATAVRADLGCSRTAGDIALVYLHVPRDRPLMPVPYMVQVLRLHSYPAMG